MTAIVTGATGFIGRHLVDALAARGEEVRCFTRGKVAVDGRANVTFHHANYNRTDLGLADGTLDGVDVVYHLAGATRAASVAEYVAANVGVTQRVLDRVATLDRRPRFVYVSSQAASGPARDADHPKTESDPEAPIEAYGRSKLAAERAVRAREGEVRSTIVRPVAVYGPGDRDFLSIFSMARRGVAVFPGIKHASVNTVFVGDLVVGIMSAGRSDVAVGQTYFLGDDLVHPWKEIYATIADAVGHPAQVEVSIPRSLVSLGGKVGDLVATMSGRPSLVNSSKAILAKPRYWLCSSARARADLGFATPTSLPEGMRATYDWYLRHRWL